MGKINLDRSIYSSIEDIEKINRHSYIIMQKEH